MRLDQEQRWYRNGLAIENCCRYLATAPFDLLLVVGHALSGRQHIVDDNNCFPCDIPRDAVISFENAVVAALGLMQAFTRLEHVDIIQPRRQFRAVGRDIPVEASEPPDILYIAAARHEHDMIGSTVRLQCRHARLEKLDTVYLALLELIDRTAESPLLLAEQIFVPGWVVMPVKSHPDAARPERLEWRMILEQVRMGKAEHPAGIPITGHHRHAAETVTQLIAVGRPRGSKRRFPGFPSPETDNMEQPSDEAEQNQEQEPCVHPDPG